MGCDAVSLAEWFASFRRNQVPSCSRVKEEYVIDVGLEMVNELGRLRRLMSVGLFKSRLEYDKNGIKIACRCQLV